MAQTMSPFIKSRPEFDFLWPELDSRGPSSILGWPKFDSRLARARFSDGPSSILGWPEFDSRLDPSSILGWPEFDSRLGTTKRFFPLSLNAMREWREAQANSDG
jgi:hypothetical protein